MRNINLAIDLYEEFVIKKQREHMTLEQLLETQDVYDKSYREEFVMFRRHLRAQEPWFMEVAKKYLQKD